MLPGSLGHDNVTISYYISNEKIKTALLVLKIHVNSCLRCHCIPSNVKIPWL